MTRPPAAALLLGLAAALCLPVHAATATRGVSFRTDDGVTLSGTWYEPSVRPAPAVVLVPMLHRTRRDWDALASQLASQGIGALAFDLRGHGDSEGPMPPEGQYALFAQDVTAARRYVAARPDVLPSRIGLCGAALGASAAVLSAAQVPGTASLALLSPAVDYRGVRIDAAFRKYAGRTLLVSSDDDPYAVRSVHDLIKAAGGAGALRETLGLSQAGDGTTMLSRHPELARSLVDWFRRTLQ